MYLNRNKSGDNDELVQALIDVSISDSDLCSDNYFCLKTPLIIEFMCDDIDHKALRRASYFRLCTVPGHLKNFVPVTTADLALINFDQWTVNATGVC